MGKAHRGRKRRTREVVHVEDPQKPGWCLCGCADPCPWSEGHTWWVQPGSGMTQPPRTSGPVYSGDVHGH